MKPTYAWALVRRDNGKIVWVGLEKPYVDFEGEWLASETRCLEYEGVYRSGQYKRIRVKLTLKS